jgi:hypothetical protein
MNASEYYLIPTLTVLLYGRKTFLRTKFPAGCFRCNMKISHVPKLCRESAKRMMDIHIVICNSRPNTPKTNVEVSSLEELIFKSQRVIWDIAEYAIIRMLKHLFFPLL